MTSVFTAVANVLAGALTRKAIDTLDPTPSPAADHNATERLKSAHAHDISLMDKTGTDPALRYMRAAVRPVSTLLVVGWYVYARANGIALGVEDYTVILGVLAFWFGFRAKGAAGR